MPLHLLRSNVTLPSDFCLLLKPTSFIAVNYSISLALSSYICSDAPRRFTPETNMANSFIMEGSYPSPASTPQPLLHLAASSEESPATVYSSVEPSCTPFDHLLHSDEVDSEFSSRNRRSRAPSPSSIPVHRSSRVDQFGFDGTPVLQRASIIQLECQNSNNFPFYSSLQPLLPATHRVSTIISPFHSYLSLTSSLNPRITRNSLPKLSQSLNSKHNLLLSQDKNLLQPQRQDYLSTVN